LSGKAEFLNEYKEEERKKKKKFELQQKTDNKYFFKSTVKNPFKNGHYDNTYKDFAIIT
jgi:hypothetical protein